MTTIESSDMTAAAPPARSRAKLRLPPALARAAVGLALPLAAGLVWELAVRAGLSEGRLLPPPSRIAATIVDLAVNDNLASHLLVTLTRVGIGFAGGAMVGIVLGAASGYSAIFRAIVDPTLQGLRAIPSLAWVPLFILWLGIFEAPKITLIAVGVFFPVYLGVASAVRSVDRKIVEVGRMFRLSGLQLVRRILLPAILPQVFTALRTGLGLGWMFVAAAEIMGTSEGLGFLLVDGKDTGKPDQVVATIIVFAVVGKLTDALLVAASRPFRRHEDVVPERAR